MNNELDATITIY